MKRSTSFKKKTLFKSKKEEKPTLKRHFEK